MSSITTPPWISTSPFKTTTPTSLPGHKHLSLKPHHKTSVICHGNNNEGFRPFDIKKPMSPTRKNYPTQNEEDDFRATNSFGIPVSLRILKMKKKLASNLPETETVPVSLVSSIVKCISSVLLMFDEILSLTEGRSSFGVSREISDSFVLMFKKVFFNSPNLFLWTMNLVADLVVFSANSVSEDDGVGLCRDFVEPEVGDSCRNGKKIHHRKLVYQRLILDDPNNPLILSNYAKFLYLIANDYDRAEEIFVRATRAEPPDAEAFSQYAMFLWKIREDTVAAEEAFLAAMDVEPHNCYHDSNYARFLWETGDTDTCFPFKSSP